MHTDNTLTLFDGETTTLGAECRKFSSTTCPAFNTRELKREAEARKRRAAKKSTAKTSTSNNLVSNSQAPASTADPSSSSDGRRHKTFSLRTYKFHALGDYADTIRKYGTTDSYSTEPVRTPNPLNIES
jgi:hypothetical protein